MDEESKTETVSQQPLKLSEIEPIERSGGQLFITREQIKDYVEPSLISACEELYDKNICTISSSANRKDVEVGEAYIDIVFGSLSPQNQKIAKKLGKAFKTYEGSERIKLAISVNEDSEVSDIQQKAKEIAHQFKKQPMTWVPRYTLGQMREIYGIDADDERHGVGSFVDEGFYYDGKGKLFYMSEEHYRKVVEEVAEE